MSIEKTNSAIDQIKRNAADAKQVEEAAERDSENLNAQIEVLHLNTTEEVAGSVETTIKAFDTSLKSAVDEKVRKPAEDAESTAEDHKAETSEDIKKDTEAISALEGIHTTTVDLSSEVGEAKGKITETLQTREEQVESLESLTKEAFDILDRADKIQLD